MIETLELAIARVRTLPPSAQDAFGGLLLALAGDGEGLLELTPQEIASFDCSFAEVERGEFASDAEIAAIWSKHGL